MGRAIKRYTDKFKNEAIKLALNTISTNQAAKDLGVPVSMLHSWVNQSKLSVIDHQTKSSDDQVKINLSQLLEKNRELQKRIKRLEEEKSILKKAATYFAKEIG